MNTQPMDEYLNRERLTDLAQFAVPDGHDLWPKIERAARASASGMTTPRPGILSLGLSRAWTAVGILLIAATFAALGFGLAVLVLSNGHDQVPATQPGRYSQRRRPYAPTASPTPSVSKDPSTSQVSTIPSREAAHAKTRDHPLRRNAGQVPRRSRLPTKRPSVSTHGTTYRPT